MLVPNIHIVIYDSRTHSHWQIGPELHWGLLSYCIPPGTLGGAAHCRLVPRQTEEKLSWQSFFLQEQGGSLSAFRKLTQGPSFRRVETPPLRLLQLLPKSCCCCFETPFAKKLLRTMSSSSRMELCRVTWSHSSAPPTPTSNKHCLNITSTLAFQTEWHSGKYSDQDAKNILRFEQDLFHQKHMAIVPALSK